MIKILSRIIKKLTKKIVVAILAIVVIAVPLLYLTLLNSNPAQAAWFDDNWLYRKSIAITNNTSAETNVYLRLTIDTSDTSKFQGDCGDLRFTKQNGDLLSYYVISGCTTSSTVVHVNFDTFPAGAQTIYYYYGNPGAENGFGNTTTTSYYATSGTGRAGFWENTTWANAHDNSNSAFTVANDDPVIGGSYDPGVLLRLFRGFIPIDTSNLPDNATIAGATLNLYLNTVADNDNDGDDWVNVVQSSQASTTDLVNDDWDQCGAVTNPTEGATRVDISNMTVSTWQAWTLNTTGLGWISKTGVTKLCIREGHDAINSQYASASQTQIGVNGPAAANPLYLSVTYYLSAFPTQASNYTVGSTGSEEKAPGPKLYWQFDDPSTGSGLVAQDSSSNNLDGTLNNTPTWNTEDLCLSGKCLYFDGSSNENVSRADNALLDFAAADNFTLSAWVRKSGASSANTVILGKASANIGTTYQGYKLYMDASGDFCFDTQDGTLAVDTACTSAVDFDDDKWHLVQGIKTGTTNITLYVDGKQRAQDASIASTGSLANSGTFYAGIDSDGLAIEWKGFIDEVKVYDYARSQAQINADFSSRGSSKGVSARMGGGDMDYLSQGLVGYWKMEESSGNASDSSGNATTLTNNNTTAYAAGKFGNSGSFTAASLHYFSTASTISGVKTVSFWVNPSANTDEYINLTASAYITSSSGTLSATGFTSPSIYVNGVLNGTITASAWNHVVVTTDTAINANAFEAGRANSSYINGTMDEIRLYNRVLTLSEVEGLYNFAPGPVGYWNLDEGYSTVAYDSSPQAKNANLNSATWSQSGKFGKAVTLNGSNQWLNVVAGTLYCPANITVSAWLNPSQIIDSADDYISFLFKTPASGSQTDSWELGHEIGTNNIWFVINNAQVARANMVLQANTWYHIVGTYDQSNIKIYINGTLMGTTPYTTAMGCTSGDVQIGRKYTPGGGANYYFPGSVDDVKIYNYPRTQKQVVEDMNAGHPAVGSPVGTSVAHWKFNEGYSTTANDSTPNDNDLTLSSASWTNSGKFGKAWNGTGALWLSRADDSDFDVTATDDYSVSLWFKSDSANNPGATEYLFNKANATTAGYAIYANTSGNLCFGIDDDTSWGPDISSCTSDDVYDNSWHHLVAVRDYSGTDKTLIYIDGVLMDSDSDSTSATLANSLSLYVGDRDGTDNGDEFNGDLDEVKVYRYALTSDEVKTEFNRASSLVLGALSQSSGSTDPGTAASQEYCVPGDSTSCAAPIGEWKFEEKTGTTAFDKGSGGNNGTLTNSPTWGNGKYGGGLQFTSSSSQYIDLGNIGSSFSTITTVEAWINPTTVSVANQAIVGYYSGASFFFAIGSSGELRGFIGDVTTQATSTNNAVSANIWQHVVMTANGSGNFKFYVNGKDVTNSSTGTDTSPNGSFMSIGRFSNVYFSGKIDEVKIFNYVRTPAQIAWDYNRGKPVGHWKLDDCQGSTTQDSSDNNNDGTITIGASGTQTAVGTCTGSANTAWKDGATGKRNYSLDFDGTDDYVTVSNSSSLAITGDLTLSAWVKTSSSNNEQEVISKFTTGGLYPGYLFSVGVINGCSAGKVGMWVGDYANWTCGNISVNDGNWHLITGILSGTTVSIYVDGKLDNSATRTPSLSSSQNLIIGGRYDLSNAYFKGQIDDVKVFNYALTATQVKELYNQGAVFFGPSTGSP